MAYTTIDNPALFFKTLLWTGDGTSPRTLSGLDFQPDWVWGKRRDDAAGHNIFDSVRTAGSDKNLQSNSNGAEGSGAPGTYGYLSAFTSDGFTVTAGSSDNAYWNNNTATYVSWNWLAGGTSVSNGDGDITSTVSANTTSGFSVVKYTGNGNSSATFGHGLGVKPKIGLLKPTSTTGNWNWWQDTTGNNSADVRMHIHLTDANNSNYPITFNTDTITLPSLADASWNGNGTEFIFYCFAEKQGYSKFGSYTGNGNADGTFVYTGFRPAWVIIKQINSTGDWMILDNKRDTDNGVRHQVYANSTGAESVEGSDRLDFLSNGIKHRSSGGRANGSSDSYIYMAFAEHPFVTEGTKAAGTAR